MQNAQPLGKTVLLYITQIGFNLSLTLMTLRTDEVSALFLCLALPMSSFAKALGNTQVLQANNFIFNQLTPYLD